MFEWDEAKRLWTLAERGLDFRDARLLFDGRPALTAIAQTQTEERYATVARIEDRLFTVIWTWRGEARRIISFRRAHDAEEKHYHARFS